MDDKNSLSRLVVVIRSTEHPRAFSRSSSRPAKARPTLYCPLSMRRSISLFFVDSPRAYEPNRYTRSAPYSFCKRTNYIFISGIVYTADMALTSLKIISISVYPQRKENATQSSLRAEKKGTHLSKTKYTDYNDLPLMLSVLDVASVLGISRAGAYELVRSDGFPSLRIGSPHRRAKRKIHRLDKRKRGCLKFAPQYSKKKRIPAESP